jgi:epsilon-lactone hydrolase
MPVNRRQILAGAAVAATGLSQTARGEEAAALCRSIPVPTTASPELQAHIAGPGNPSWSLKPASAQAWHEIVDTATAAIEKRIADWPEKHGVTVRETRIDGVRVFWVTPKRLPKKNRRRVLLNFHGGGYVYAPGHSGLEDAILIASRGFRVLSVDYRMAPDFPYPAAIDDAETVWRYLSRKIPGRRLGICGTSTGGGITLALIHRCKRKKLVLPAAIWAGTPWSDLTKTGDTYFTNAFIDKGLVSYDGILGAAAEVYAAGRDLRDPELSPIYGEFAGFPPTLLTSGTRDLFLSNTVRVQSKLQAAHVPVELTVIEAFSHGDYIGLPDTPESDQVYSGVTRFFERNLAA